MRTLAPNDAQLARDPDRGLHVRTGQVLRADDGHVQNVADIGTGATGGQCPAYSAWAYDGTRRESSGRSNASLRSSGLEGYVAISLSHSKHHHN